MKFIISSSNLLKALQTVNGVILANNTLPILDNFLFELTEGQLKITASDLETTMMVTVTPDMAEEFGSIAVPAKILIETLKTFSNIPISFTSHPETFGIVIATEEGNFKIAGQDADEFPKQPDMPNTTSITLNSSFLASAIHYTILATGNDELRPVMSGVYCELNEEGVTFVATDAHKLVRYRRTDVQTGVDASFILPKKPLHQLRNALADLDEPVAIEYNEKNAYFAFHNINLYCRLIDGKYPNYEVVIPKDNPNKLIVDRVQLVNSLRRVGIFANQSTQQIRFKISGKELVLSAEDVDYANEAKERLNCSYEGDDMEIGFSSRFMYELVNNIEGEQVLVELSNPNRAGLISPANPTDPAESLLMLIMPVMLNN
ncbi:MAG TPA: DNA polymerase III subunit beta [Bacteroidales bacterium]|nr:DNA polymerase III subunit beta [Bacteroidales bacterium]HRZ50106.1 DNA polymerase III subunit beta [Bacteroidales bacterium]